MCRPGPRVLVLVLVLEEVDDLETDRGEMINEKERKRQLD